MKTNLFIVIYCFYAKLIEREKKLLDSQVQRESGKARSPQNYTIRRYQGFLFFKVICFFFKK